MSAKVPVRNAQAVEELAGIALIFEAKFGVHAGIAVHQLQAAIAELIEALEPAVTEEGMNQCELDRLRAAVARVKGGAA